MTKIQIDQPTEDGTAPDIRAMLAPLFTWHGKDFYPVFGAEGDDDGDGGTDGDQDDDDNDDDGASDDKGGSEQDKPVTRDEFDKLRNQLSQSDKKRAAAEKSLKAIEDSKKDELTKATERAEELEKTVAAREKDISEMRLQNAFLMADVGITWHDPADALALAERRGYLDGVVDEDGKVDERVLATKLREMAKAKPNLVKKESDTDSGGGKGGEKIAPTGSKVGGKAGGKKDDGPDLSRYARLLDR